MHMADALVSPAVGGTMWGVSAAAIAYSARKVKLQRKDSLVPLMGVLGAFVFAAQMINFTIPGTGSSGHIAGGLLLAILLGPEAAFLVIASVLVVQAFFFADGGLLALGCNMFNMGFFPAFIAYPFVYRVLVRKQYAAPRGWVAAVAAAVVALLLGAFSVVVETKASGISALPFGTFVMLMLPIHFAIGIVEGLATAAVVLFVARARPEVLAGGEPAAGRRRSLRPVLIGLLIAAGLVGGALSWFASTHPDGLEWSIAGLTGHTELAQQADTAHQKLAQVQGGSAIMPDYGFKRPGAAGQHGAARAAPAWPAVSPETSLSGLLGGLLTLVLAVLVGLALRTRRAPGAHTTVGR